MAAPIVHLNICRIVFKDEAIPSNRTTKADIAERLGSGLRHQIAASRDARRAVSDPDMIAALVRRSLVATGWSKS